MIRLLRILMLNKISEIINKDMDDLDQKLKDCEIGKESIYTKKIVNLYDKESRVKSIMYNQIKKIKQ